MLTVDWALLREMVFGGPWRDTLDSTGLEPTEAAELVRALPSTRAEWRRKPLLLGYEVRIAPTPTPQKIDKLLRDI